MKLKDLKGLLERYEAEVGGEVEVRVMTQRPSRLKQSRQATSRARIRTIPSQSPFEHALAGVTDTWAMLDFSGEAPETLPAEENIVYIVEGPQLGYGKKDAWETAER
jgi:hypothetical protein